MPSLPRFTGLAGSLFAHKIGYLAPDAFTVQTSIQLLLMVVVGGLGSLHGVIYGAIFLGLLPQVIAFGRDVLPSWIGEIPGLDLASLASSWCCSWSSSRSASTAAG